MKKLIAILLTLALVLSAWGCSAGQQPAEETKPVEKTPIILNADGSFGGSLDEALYGKGAPKNGEFDVPNSDYFVVNNDFYNMASTEERMIFPQFSTYQQTMQDSSGLACLLMVLRYAGKTYTELELLEKYEEVTGETVHGNGTTEKGLAALVESLGLDYTTSSTSLNILAKDEKSQNKMKEAFQECLKEGKFILARYQSPNGYGWKVVVGYDTLGNVKDTVTNEESDSFGDDVIIFADPNDCWDHKQDGYTIERAKDFIVWWRQMEIDGTLKDQFSYVVIDPNIDVEYTYEPVDETPKQTLYDLHLALNPDGTYGSTRDQSLYGKISSGNGWYNHTDANYYKINDFYNMGTEGSRILLTNYSILQQTMGSSCGICAVNSVLAYYGEETAQYDMELSYLELYEAVSGETVKGKGTSVGSHNLTLTELGYESEFARFYPEEGEAPVYDSYEEYMQHMRTNLEAGRPIVVSTNMGSGHYIVVIGMDDMGTEFTYDDVIITADSSDYWDGYQDGYVVQNANKFFRQHTNSSYKVQQANVVIYPKN